MATPLARFASALRRKRRWLQFSLRSLMVLVLALSVPLGWLAVKQNQKRREREAVAAFEKFRGRVEYNWSE